MLIPRKSPMLSIKSLINTYIFNYYISSVTCVCRLEPFNVPFHYNCTICPICMPRIHSIMIIIYCLLNRIYYNMRLSALTVPNDSWLVTLKKESAKKWQCL
jgi:hypothetical protein